jgi:NADH-quinone oxidoreductase subunit L
MEHPIEVQTLRWIVLLPLLGAAVNGLAGAWMQKQFGKRAITLIACTPVLAGFVLAVSVFVRLLGLPPEQRFLLDTCWTWIDIGSLRADIAFWADPLSATMILVVTGVGGLIHLYSAGYMHDEPAYWRYFAYLNLFTGMMLTLVLGDNLLLLFVGWEGVGLCSYALIGFWYKEWANASAGTKAFIVNRVGDFAFTLGAFLLFWTLAGEGHGSVVFRDIAHHASALEGKTFAGIAVATLVTWLFFIGATGKSAQIPLYVWLPDAMAGPTPVSALIHAATMVTAGIYMIARLNFLYDMAPATLAWVGWIGAATALMAATIALTQNDIKKVLAYSTVSQLGYMFMGLGAGAYVAAVFHLVTHAFFKACLFLGSGSVIHAMGGEQDMRKMGGLKQWMPHTHWTFLLSTIAIAGIFPFSGFFSKDEILWKNFSGHHYGIWVVGVLGALLTAFYMFRLLFLTFYGENRSDHHTREHLHESPPIMTYPLMILAGLAVVGGLMGVPEALGGSHRLEHWLAPVFAHGHETHAHGEHNVYLEWALMVFSVGVALSGIFLAAQMYLWKRISPDRFAELGGGRPYQWSLNKYWIDELYDATVIAFTLWLTRACAWFDRVIIDGAVNGAAALTRAASWINGAFDKYVIDGIVNFVADATMIVGGRVRRLQTGNINGYLYAVVAGVVVVMVVRLWPS